MCEWCRVEEVGRGVYAVIDVDGGWFRSNSGLINMGDYTLVVDTQYNEARARDLVGLIKRLNLPDPGLIVNTHHHGDHVWGNHVIGAKSIMHVNAAKHVDMLRSIGPNMYRQFFPHLDFTGAKYTGPDIIVGDWIELRGAYGSVAVRHYGPAHTTGDIVVEVGWSDVVFMGDLVFNEVTPLAIDGTVKGWLEVLSRVMEAYEGKVLIGGHGPVATSKTIDLLIKYFKHVLGATGYLLNEGLSDPLEIAVKATNGPLEGWRERERIVLNVARAIMDLRGEQPGTPLEKLPELAMKMAEYRRITSRG